MKRWRKREEKRDDLSCSEKEPQLGRDVSATKADVYQGHSCDQHWD